MDSKKELPLFVTNLLKKIFTIEGYNFPDRSTKPKHKNVTTTPVQGLMVTNSLQNFRRFYENAIFKSLDRHERTTIGPSRNKTTVTPVLEKTTAKPSLPWYYFGFNRNTPQETTTRRPFTRPPTRYNPMYERSNHNSIGDTISQPAHSSGLEKCFWVVLGGIGVLVLMAFFMKLGKPIRRVRRQLSNARPAANETRLNLNSDDGNLDMGSLLHMSETTASIASELYLDSDPPPPYTECVGSSIHKQDIEEPPPHYSEIFVAYNNIKDGEPRIHIRLHNDEYVQNNLNEDHALAAELIANTISCNDSENTVLDMKTELLIDNGRIIDRPSLDLNSNNNETGVPNSDNVEEPTEHS